MQKTRPPSCRLAQATGCTRWPPCGSEQHGGVGRETGPAIDLALGNHRFHALDHGMMPGGVGSLDFQQAASPAGRLPPAQHFFGEVRPAGDFRMHCPQRDQRSAAAAVKFDPLDPLADLMRPASRATRGSRSRSGHRCPIRHSPRRNRPPGSGPCEGARPARAAARSHVASGPAMRPTRSVRVSCGDAGCSGVVAGAVAGRRGLSP